MEVCNKCDLPNKIEKEHSACNKCRYAVKKVPHPQGLFMVCQSPERLLNNPANAVLFAPAVTTKEVTRLT